MKRSILIVLLLSVVTLGFAQKKTTTPPPDMPIDNNTQLITYQDVVQVDASAKDLYDRALKWAKSFYHNPSEVILPTMC